MAAGERLQTGPCGGSPAGMGLACLSHSEEGVPGSNFLYGGDPPGFLLGFSSSPGQFLSRHLS
jgi:hypothetical protein